MGFVFAGLLRGLTGLVFSSAAVVTAMAYLKRVGQPAPATPNGISTFQIGKLVLYAVAIFLGYKIFREIFK